MNTKPHRWLYSHVSCWNGPPLPEASLGTQGWWPGGRWRKIECWWQSRSRQWERWRPGPPPHPHSKAWTGVWVGVAGKGLLGIWWQKRPDGRCQSSPRPRWRQNGAHPGPFGGNLSSSKGGKKKTHIWALESHKRALSQHKRRRAHAAFKESIGTRIFFAGLSEMGGAWDPTLPPSLITALSAASSGLCCCLYSMRPFLLGWFRKMLSRFGK